MESGAKWRAEETNKQTKKSGRKEKGKRERRGFLPPLSLPPHLAAFSCLLFFEPFQVCEHLKLAILALEDSAVAATKNDIKTLNALFKGAKLGSLFAIQVKFK